MLDISNKEELSKELKAIFKYSEIEVETNGYLLNINISKDDTLVITFKELILLSEVLNSTKFEVRSIGEEYTIWSESGTGETEYSGKVNIRIPLKYINTGVPWEENFIEKIN